MRWFEDVNNVFKLGRALVEAGFTANELQRYYEKPWKWDDEWQASEISEDALQRVLDGEDLSGIIEQLSA